jgi:2'-5' RNA ligase
MTEREFYLRVFFALEMTDPVLKPLAKITAALKKAFPQKNIRWAAPEDLHVTLQFQKALDPLELARLVHKVRTAIAGFTPFDLQLGTPEWFPGEDSKRFIVLPAGPQTELSELAAKVGEGMLATGYEPEKRFYRGHLTLCRLNSEAPVTNIPNIAVKIPPLTIRQVVLFRSELFAKGPNYTILERFHSTNL